MNRTRAIFKLVLRYCRNHIVQLKANACAANLNNKDPLKFWNSVYTMGNNNTTNHVVSVGGVSGTESITTLWKEHFEKLYNSPHESRHKPVFQDKILKNPNVEDRPYINLNDM